MLSVSIDLGSFKVAGKTPNLTLTLLSSLTIALPSSWPDTLTAEELCQASSSGTIWISKAGSCQIEISSLINGQVPDPATLDPSIMAAVANFLPDCPVWKHTGLELRADHASHARPDHNHARAWYFLHHPDLSSEMIAPPNVPSAQLKGLKCEVNYSFNPTRNKARSKAHESQQAAMEPPRLVPQVSEAPPGYSCGLRSSPKRSKKAAAAREDVNDALPGISSVSGRRSAPGHDSGEQEDIESLVSEAIADMACLLDFAFRKLIGVRGALPGVRTINSMLSPSLTEIAPAVWDLGYLQTMSIHAQAIPTIAAGIARLRHARSSTLREKPDLLVHTRTPLDDGQESVDVESETMEEVKKRLWLLCQTRIRPGPMKTPFVQKRVDTEQTASQVVPKGQELESPPLYLDEFDSDALIVMEDYDLVADDDPYDALPEVLAESNEQQMGGFPHSTEPYMSEDVHLPTDEWTGSSDGDYFYTDGQGNVYPIERQGVPQHDQVGWPSTPQLLYSEGFDHGEDEDGGENWDGDEHQTYIMYHEVQHWSPVAGVHIHAQDDQPYSPPPHPGYAPFNDCTGD